MKDIDPKALFRLSVLGPLVSRERLDRGDLQKIIRQLAQQEYAIPGSRRHHIGEKTLQSWYYAWKQHGLEGLCGKPRVDRWQSKLPPAVQAAILAAKRENPRRSIRQIRLLLESAGIVAHDTLSRCAVHRLLQANGLSRIIGSASLPEEKRSFVAEHAGSIWYGDVLHGPHLSLGRGRRKTYLASLMDDASRLIAHSAFCFSETAIDIEGVLKQALLKRGVPKMLIVDSGAAYRASTLQGICARLSIRLVHCRPYAPEGYVPAKYMARRTARSMQHILNRSILVRPCFQRRASHVGNPIHSPLSSGSTLLKPVRRIDRSVSRTLPGTRLSTVVIEEDRLGRLRRAGEPHRGHRQVVAIRSRRRELPVQYAPRSFEKIRLP
ncbi:homeodomain-containing protein [Paraburkholderia sp. BL23I1N1]|nr:homeodomain-containing protein [Paraburkholderia sp. BL27I4N3]RKE35477.1 homeodomain-containing protein [Paraburkholderia sp. BL23I1N1]